MVGGDDAGREVGVGIELEAEQRVCFSEAVFVLVEVLHLLLQFLRSITLHAGHLMHAEFITLVREFIHSSQEPTRLRIGWKAPM